jgi:uncharacterized protein YoxC
MTTKSEQGAATVEDLDEAGRELSPARGIAIDALGYVPRLVAGALEDLRTIAESVRVLPDVARTLASIESETAEMNREVKLMRQGVDRLGDKVEGLDDDIVRVAEGVAPLDAKLEDLRRTMHPLSRAGALFARRREVEEAAADAERSGRSDG